MGKKLTYLFFILFISTQCTLEKHLYHKGYALSSNKRMPQVNYENAESELDDFEEEVQLANEEDSIVSFSGRKEYEDNVSVPETADAREEIVSVPDDEFQEVSKDTVTKQKTFVTSGIVSLATFVAAGSIAVISLTLWVEYLIFLALGLYLISLFAGFASIIEFHDNRSSYRSNVFGTIAFILDAILLAPITLLIILAIFS